MADDNRTPGNDREPSGGGNWMKSLLIWAGILLALVLFVQIDERRLLARRATRSLIPTS